MALYGYDTVEYLRSVIRNGTDADLHDIIMCQHMREYVDCDRLSTPLHLACENGRSDMVEMLLENGSDVFAEDVYGRTPGDVAALYPHLEYHVDCLRLVVHEMNRVLAGSTALHYAASHGKHTLYHAMLQHGMEPPSTLDRDGLTARQWAATFADLE